MADAKLAFSKIEELIKLKSNEELKLIIEKADPSELTDNCGTTLLHLAAKHNNADLIEFLLPIGYDYNVKNVCGTTPLLMAASYNSSEALNVLLEADADIFIPAVKGKSTLQVIIDKKRGIPKIIIADVLKYLRRKFVEPEKIVDVLLKANCPLDYVLLMNDTQVTEVMLRRKSRLMRAKVCNRLLECAMGSLAYLDNVRVLVEYGCGDCDSMRMYINTLCNMIEAPRLDYQEAARVFVEKMDEWNLYQHFWLIESLCKVFQEKSKTVVSFLLDCAVDEQVRNRYGFQLIVHIFENKHFEASEILDDRAFNANALNMQKSTGLCVSAAIGSKRNIRFLLDKGADPNFTDNRGLTAMHYAQLADCCIPLLRRGADLQIVGKQGQTIFDEFCDSTTVQLAHLTMIEAQGVLVKQEIRDKIDADSEMKYLFKKCGWQLDWMRDFKIFQNVTLFTVLTEKIAKFSYGIRSQEVVYMILNRCKVGGMHDYYCYILRAKLKKAAKMYDLKWKAAKVIADVMDNNPGHLVIEMIVNYLTYNDLQVFA